MKYKIGSFIVIAALVALLVATIMLLFRDTDTPSSMQTRPARVKAIREMVELCTAEIHEEIPLKDSVNGKWIVARQTINGKISFNLDSLRIEDKGDSLIVFLPPERVEILEGAMPRDYEVLDSWNSRNPIFGSPLTASEENVLKSRWKRKAIGRIYSKGYVKKAREDAKNTLTNLFGKLRGSKGDDAPVTVIDPTPQGSFSSLKSAE